MGEPALKENNNVCDFIQHKSHKEGIKLKKDGTPKKSGGNKRKGVSSLVEPLRNLEDIKKFRQYFKDKEKESFKFRDKLTWKRNYALFIVGTGTALRISDILKLKWKDVISDGLVDIVDKIRPNEKKTHKFNVNFMTKDIKSALNNYYNALNSKKLFDINDYIFDTDTGKAMTEQNVIVILKKAAKELNIKYNIGTHTMRKTYAYQYLIANKGDSRALTLLQARLNHSTPRQTLDYAGIMEDELRQMDNQISNIYRSIDNYKRRD